MTAPENARGHRETVIRAQLKKRLQLAGKPLMPAWDDATVAAIMAATEPDAVVAGYRIGDKTYHPDDVTIITSGTPAITPPAPSSPPRPATRTTTRKPAPARGKASP
jgi:hypothetical protein